MKIAHLISSSGLFGAEKVMLKLAVASKEQGHEPWVVAIDNRHNPHLEVIREARLLGLETHYIVSRGRFDFEAARNLADFVREKKIEIVHSHNYKADLLAFLASRKVRVRLVATLHGYIGRGWKLKVYEAFDRWLMRFFNKVILVDSSLRRWFEEGPVSCIVINNGIDTQEFKPLARDAKNEELVIGTVGRLSAEKGYDYLLKAFSRILEEGRSKRENRIKFKLLLVGEGPLKEKLKAQSAKLNIEDKVEFAGFQSDVKPFYEKMDIFCSSSLIEHFPVAVLEAMACGKAIIATDVGGTRGLIKDRETGLLIKRASVRQLRDGLLELAKDAILRKYLGESARVFVEQKCSVSQMVASYLEVYKALL